MMLREKVARNMSLFIGIDHHTSHLVAGLLFALDFSQTFTLVYSWSAFL